MKKNWQNFITNVSEFSYYFGEALMKRYTCYSKSCYIAIKIFELELKETVAKSCSVKKVFLEVSQNSQENTCARDSFLIKFYVSGLRPATLLKKSLWHRYFPVNFAKFLRTSPDDCFCHIKHSSILYFCTTLLLEQHRSR